MNKVRKQDLRVGQKVKLVDNRDYIKGDYAQGWAEPMEYCFGDTVTIEAIRRDVFRGGLPYIRVKENDWSWDLRFLELLGPISKVHNVHDFEDEDYYILPIRYTLEKVIENGNAVICWVEDCETREMIKTVAKCQEGDNFDLHKGVEICMYKTLRKIAEKNLKRF